MVPTMWGPVRNLNTHMQSACYSQKVVLFVHIVQNLCNMMGSSVP